MKRYIPTFNEYVIESVNEGAVKAFEMDFAELVKQIKGGLGWIDPDYVEETWENMNLNSVDYSIVKKEILNRLIKAGVLYYAERNDPESKGKRVTSLAQLGLKESIDETIDESKEEFVPATLIKDSGDLRRGDLVKVNALDFTKKGDKDKIGIIRPDGKKAEILKGDLSVKI
jgi:hypothetical protein